MLKGGIELLQRWVPWKANQAQVVSSEIIYIQATIIHSAGCIDIFIYVHMCTNNKNKKQTYRNNTLLNSFSNSENNCTWKCKGLIVQQTFIIDYWNISIISTLIFVFLSLILCPNSALYNITLVLWLSIDLPVWSHQNSFKNSFFDFTLTPSFHITPLPHN